MIARIWHGWTTKKDACNYESLLKEKIFPSIEQKKIKGYRKISLLKSINNSTEEVEFITIMLFDSIYNLKDFVGENYQEAYVPVEAQKLLLRHDLYSMHYEIINEIKY